MEELKPYRARIDSIDDQIVDLLAQRTGIIREVGSLKARRGIAPILPERVEEVRERCAARAAERNLDADFVRDLYTRIIGFSCDLEEDIIAKS